MWQNLKCCTITIPEIEDGNNNFDGIFSIENNYLNVWIQYSKKDSNYIQLINKMQSDKPFSIQIKNGENSSIIGFNCICNTPFSFHIYDTNSNNQKHIEGRYEPADELGLLSIKCELWTHGLINTTIDEKVFREIRFNMLYSEPWFNLNNDARIMNINDDIKIIFDCGKRQTWNHLTREYSEKKTGNIICQSEAGFSINDALEISIEIQTLIRYMSDISYPLGQIKLQLKSEYISDLSGPPTPIDIYGNWVLPSVANKPKPLAYVNMPYYLTDLTENGFCNWIREWKKAKAAIINAENARNKVLEIQILEYVKSFDSLTSILLPKKLATANNNEFEKWKNRTVQKIMEDNPFEYNKERINRLLNNLKYQDSLSTIMRDTLNANINQIKELKINNDIKDIVRYFKGLRNANAHPCSFNISQLPKGYTLVDMNKIAKKMMRIIIDNNILCITKKSV